MTASTEEPFDLATTVKFVIEQICSDPMLALEIIGQIALAAENSPNTRNPDAEFYRETIDHILDQFWDSFNRSEEGHGAAN